MTKILQFINSLAWGPPTLVLILGVGLYLSLATGFVQIRLLPKALAGFLSRLRGGRSEQGSVSAFQALCTALAATVGTGNLAGVAGAIALGGPGAIFWMWICAVFGMVTKFAEATLAVRFRQRTAEGEYIGGPMYMIRDGLGKRWSCLSGVYCFFGVVAALGVGNATQINAVISGVNDALGAFGVMPSDAGNLLMGIAIAALVCMMLLGGAKRIGAVAEKLVPFVSAAYILFCVTVLILRYQAIPAALRAIVLGAFTPKAVTGGMLGSAFQALRVGVSRGVFTNEAGMGTASISHAAAQVDHPVEQGLMGIVEVFLDTIVICTMTALVILCSGIAVPYGTDDGVSLTIEAFSSVLGSWISVPIALFLCCFAFATILGWGLYGGRCAQFLFGHDIWKKFVFLQVAASIVGAVLKADVVWILSEIVNGLMAIPNLIALAALSPELIRLIKEYSLSCGSKAANGGTYESFNQCKSVRTVTYAQIPSSGRRSKA